MNIMHIIIVIILWSVRRSSFVLLGLFCSRWYYFFKPRAVNTHFPEYITSYDKDDCIKSNSSSIKF